MLPEQDQDQIYLEIREAVRDLCAGFDSAYWQRVEEQNAFPETFVQALTQAGWLSALIPEALRRLWPAADSGVGDHGGNQPQRRQLGRLATARCT